MIVLIHVLVALTSIGYTTYVYIRPSTKKFLAAYGLVGATVASGSYLIWTTPSHMIQGCTEGLIYIGIVSVGIIAARVKLGRMQQIQQSVD